jgi:Zn-finger protein
MGIQLICHFPGMCFSTCPNWCDFCLSYFVKNVGVGRWILSRKSWDCLEEIDGEDPVRRAFSKMSIQLYNCGEGWVLDRCFFVVVTILCLLHSNLVVT